jgi:hypothetical protein
LHHSGTAGPGRDFSLSGDGIESSAPPDRQAPSHKGPRQIALRRTAAPPPGRIWWRLVASRRLDIARGDAGRARPRQRRTAVTRSTARRGVIGRGLAVPNLTRAEPAHRLAAPPLRNVIRGRQRSFPDAACACWTARGCFVLFSCCSPVMPRLSVLLHRRRRFFTSVHCARFLFLLRSLAAVLRPLLRPGGA